MESSKTEPGKLTSLEEYIARMPQDQTEILYLCIPNRGRALDSPYYEAFKTGEKEVLFFYDAIDEFAIGNLGQFKEKKIVSIETTTVHKPKEEEKPKKEEVEEFVQWMKDALRHKAAAVKTTTRLVDSPAIIVDHDSATYRRMMKYIDSQHTPKLPKQILEINAKHPVMKKLDSFRITKPHLAKLVAEQIYENALVAAGLVDDVREMIPRLNQILNAAMDGEEIAQERTSSANEASA